MKTILVAEDRDASRELLDAVLSAAGYRVLLAADGEEALGYAETAEIDLVILDLRMPRLDGYGALVRLRAMERYKDVPIMALTASAMPEEEQRALESGFTSFITKPVNPSELRQRISRLLHPGE